MGTYAGRHFAKVAKRQRPRIGVGVLPHLGLGVLFVATAAVVVLALQR